MIVATTGREIFHVVDVTDIQSNLNNADPGDPLAVYVSAVRLRLAIEQERIASINNHKPELHELVDLHRLACAAAK